MWSLHHAVRYCILRCFAFFCSTILPSIHLDTFDKQVPDQPSSTNVLFEEFGKCYLWLVSLYNYCFLYSASEWCKMHWRFKTAVTRELTTILPAPLLSIMFSLIIHRIICSADIKQLFLGRNVLIKSLFIVSFKT